MKKYRLLTALLSLTLLACLSGVEGQYVQYTPQQGEVIGQSTPYAAEAIGYPKTTQTAPAGQNVTILSILHYGNSAKYPYNGSSAVYNGG